MKKLAFCVLAAALVSPEVLAQTTDAYGTIIRVPVAVNSSTYSTTVFVHNSSTETASVAVKYYGATGTPLPGERICTTLTIPANGVVERSLAELCGFDPNPTGPSNYGQLSFVEQSTSNVPISAYTRIQAFSGQGFSVEGFKIGSLTGGAGQSISTGLRRAAAAPGYQSNCFVGSVGEPVTVNWSLRDGAGTQIGASQTVNLTANETVRYLEVFNHVGAPAGDYNNVEAVFTENTVGSNPGFVAYCTVQENQRFDGDFRIAKEANPDDERSKKVGVSTTSGLGQLLGLLSGQDVFGVYLQHPDYVQCAINGSGASSLEMRLEDPLGNVVAGGNNVTSFGKVYLGERSTRNNGVNGLWKIKVETRTIIGLAVNYSVTCQSGNGSNPPLYLGRRDFEEF